MRSPLRWSVHRTRTALVAGLLLLVAGLILGPSVAVARQDAQSGVTGVTDPTVRIVHASPDAPAVDILVDGQPVAQNVAFGSATEYAPLAPGDHQVQVVPTGGGDPVIDQTVTLEGGMAYILAAVGTAANLQLQQQQVDINAVEQGQARFRVVHAVPDAPAVDVAIAGTQEPLVGGIEFQNGSDYQNINPGTYDLEVRGTDTQEVLAEVPGVRLDPGQVYDIFALGQPGGQNVQILPLATQANVPCGQVLGLGDASATCLRIVHAAPDAGPVDVYVSEAPAIQGLEFGGATEFVAAPSGQQQIRLVPAGGTLDQAVFDTTQDLGSGQAFQVTAAGLAAEGLNVWLSGVDLSPLPENQARVRVVHASSDTEAIDVAVAGGQTPFDAIAYGSQSGYVAFDAGTYGFQLRLNDGDTLLREATDVQLQPGLVYDIYALGQSEDGTLQMVVLAAQAGIRQGMLVQAGAPMATPQAGAAEATPVIAVGATPVIATPGAATPAATPIS